MIGLVSVKSNAVESNPKYQAAVKAQQEKLNPKVINGPVNVEADIVEEPSVKPAAQTIRQIIANVASKHGLTHDDVVGKSRKANIIAARHEAIGEVYLARPHLSLKGIARHFGNKDHTTIFHALKKRGIKYV
jgi:chromosomal replication initiation ATPase DnaA